MTPPAPSLFFSFLCVALPLLGLQCLSSEGFLGLSMAAAPAFWEKPLFPQTFVDCLWTDAHLPAPLLSAISFYPLLSPSQPFSWSPTANSFLGGVL